MRCILIFHSTRGISVTHTLVTLLEQDSTWSLIIGWSPAALLVAVPLRPRVSTRAATSLASQPTRVFILCACQESDDIELFYGNREVIPLSFAPILVTLIPAMLLCEKYSVWPLNDCTYGLICAVYLALFAPVNLGSIIWHRYAI